jgi:surface polysaccharide O-acyltransferase-like enzyme
MISGANLLGYRERYSTKEFFKKRFHRVLIPLIIWSLLWVPYRIYRGWMVHPTIKTIIESFIYNDLQNVYWFFYAIIGIYLCIPILSIIAKKENKKAIQYLMLLCLIQFGIIPFVFGIFNKPIPSYTNLPIVGQFLFYVLSGWYMSTFKPKKNQLKLIYISGLICAILTFLGTYYFSLADNHLTQLFFDYNSIFTCIVSVSVFAFFQSIDWEKLINPIVTKLIISLSSFSFGIYIVHEFFIYQASVIFMINLDDYHWLFMIVGPLIVYLISSICVFLIKKIPFGKHIIP